MKTITVYDMANVKSSNIESVAYGGNTMYINFLNGTSYSYNNVLLEDYEALKKAESVGKHFNSKVKNAGYETKKLESVSFEVEKSKYSDLETKLILENATLTKKIEDLYQALKIKQEKIDELESNLNHEFMLSREARR